MTGHVLATNQEVISYNYSNTHKAIDIVGPNHTADDIIAFEDGIVEIVVNNMKYTDHNSKGNATYGNFVKIKHEDGTKTLYAHLKYNSIQVQVGQKITKGSKIGTMGNTGNAYGTHLHFEVRDINENRLNPIQYLNGEKTIKKQTDITPENSSVNTEENKNAPNEDKETLQIDDITEYTIEKTNDNTSVKEVKVSKTNQKYLNNESYHGDSIVDGLKNLGINSSFEHRKVIAQQNGIENYKGTFKENVYLLNLLKNNQLKA